MMSDLQAAGNDSLERPAPVMISLLGIFRLSLHNQVAPINNGSKSEHLLTCLALTRQHRLRRNHILERLWPECDPSLAGQSLNSLIYQLNKLSRKFLEWATIISHDNGYYYLNSSAGVGVDIDYFEAWQAQGQRLLRSGQAKKGVAYCEKALALYRGDLQGDSSIRTIIEKERLRTAFLALLAQLADHYYSQGEPTQALEYVHRLLSHDPCREDAHRRAMRCYVRLGTRAQALRQYQICCQILAAEFDTGPEPATETLFNQIRLDPGSI